ncbi:hypothetical protein [Algoriphagus sp. Y33]|uniref:hypothetical protein n=1 Tax=Algoriphagus sp. Y33 TaxID=2772483 RepID=UPI00177D1030|nr:hypothetical protein [Algoriphagus sp. Y33]
MNKISGSQILTREANLAVKKLQEADAFVSRIISETKEKQAEVLKQKEVDQRGLRMVVQL